MNAPTTDWVSPIVIVAAALILGALVYFFNKRRTAPLLGGAPDLERQDLLAKRDALVLQLRDTALMPHERTRVELETADVLRRLDAQPKHSGLSTQDSGLKSAMDPTIKGFLWGATSMAALAALLFFVYQQASPRQQGDELTGSTAMQSQPSQQQQQPAQTDPQVLQLEAAVRSQPNNITLRNQLAEAYLQRENLMGVFEQSQAVLAQSPDDSRALTFQGLVRMAMGKSDEAVQMLQHATRSDPKNLDGWVALAWVYAQTNRMSEAEKAIGAATREVPQEQARLATVLQQMKQHLAQGGGTEQASGLPEGHPAIGDTPAPAPAAAGPGVRVTLDLDASAKQRTGVLFVIARNAGGGPPVAVKRIVASTFPIDVELTSADSMMGQPLPATFRLEARLDSDGDPLTRPATDPSAAQDGVGPGTVVRLALK